MKRTTPREHGTKACYVFGEWGGDSANGCRCADCRAAIARYERERKRNAQEAPPYVNAGPAREHIAWLATQGVGLKTVAKVSGVAHGALWKIVYGVPSIGRGPSKRVRPATSEAILAVTPRDGAGGSRVPAGPVWEDINRLLGRGWTKSAISRAIGQGGVALQIGEQFVTRRNARAIRALLDQPVPDDVGKAWSVHHRAAAVEEEPAPALPGDEVTLALVELLEERIDQPWRSQAACRGRKPWIWFPARGDHQTLATAKGICGACSVRAECLAANLDKRDGVFGGLSGHERRVLRKKQAAA